MRSFISEKKKVYAPLGALSVCGGVLWRWCPRWRCCAELLCNQSQRFLFQTLEPFSHPLPMGAPPVDLAAPGAEAEPLLRLEDVRGDPLPDRFLGYVLQGAVADGAATEGPI